MIKNTLLTFLALCSISTYAQLEYSGNISTEGYYATGEELPFWMYHNKRGRISEDTNLAGWMYGKAVYNFGAASSLEAGAGILYQDGIGDNGFLDEAYLQFRNDWLQIIAGRKQKEELYNGLSASNENILWSLNARPLPGLQFSTTRPILIFPEAGLGFEASLEEYVLEEDRHVSNARVHHKSFHLVYEPNEDWRIRAGIQHFAQWSGDSKTTGPQPDSFTDYLRIFAGREGGENAVGGDQVNVLGNHLGSYELFIKRSFLGWSLEFIYNHVFEDGSGSRYANFPDGRYGFFVDLKNKESLVSSFIYEFTYTKNQSVNSTSPHKNDNYFNNNVTYKTGWTYYQRILGAPYFQYDPVENRIGNNRFVAHHFGFSGKLSGLPYKILASYARNGGTVERAYFPKQDVGSLYSQIGLFRRWVDLDLQLAADVKDNAKPVFGVGVSLSKRF